MNIPIEVIKNDVDRHGDDIKNIHHRLNELSMSHQEAMLIIKTYMDNMVNFEKKIDRLSDNVQQLMPGKKDWEIEKRIDILEEETKHLNKYRVYGVISMVVLVITNPHVFPLITNYFLNKF